MIRIQRNPVNSSFAEISIRHQMQGANNDNRVTIDLWKILWKFPELTSVQVKR